jgi:hypothetical protein
MDRVSFGRAVDRVVSTADSAGQFLLGVGVTAVTIATVLLVLVVAGWLAWTVIA